MIETRLEHYCDDCPDLDPVVDRLLYPDGSVWVQYITCSNSIKCRKIFEKAKEDVIEKYERTTTE